MDAGPRRPKEKENKDNKDGSTSISIGCSIIGDCLNDVGMFPRDESYD